MRKTSLLTLLSALLLGAALFCPARQATAADAKPFATVSFSGYDALMSDADYIGKLGDNAELPKFLESTLQAQLQGKSLEGLDKTRPWGMVYFPNPENATGEPNAAAFVPVTDMDKMLALLATLGQPAEEGPNGTKKIGPEAFVKQVGNWAFVSNKPEFISDMPADPLTLLGGTDKKYDVAWRLLVGNLTDEMRTAFLGQVDMFSQMFIMQAQNEASAAQFKQLVDQIKQLANELDTITVGLVINDAAGKTYVDIEVTAKPGTQTAAQMADVKKAPSEFAGFYMPEATLTANWVGTMADADIARANTQIKAMHKEFIQALGRQGLSDDQLEKAKQYAGDLVDVLTKTIAAGKTDGGVAIWLDASTAAIVAGGVVVDSKKLETTLKEIVAMGTAETPELGQFIKLDAETYEGVNLHTFTMPVPPIPNHDQVVDMVGENLEVVVGIAPTGMCIAAGRDAMTKLKAALDASKSAATTEVLPMRFSLAVTPLVQFVGKVVDDDDVKQKTAMIANVLAQAGSDNHVLVTSEPIPDGVRQRIEIEQGLLKVLGSMSKMATAMMPMP
ncbi:MAG: hypothetical protein JW888_02365 [Pirellulales bacterium]|nr:hypothetical protein [Pirellulales bacterium]